MFLFFKLKTSNMKLNLFFCFFLKFFSFLRPSLFGISLFSSKKQRDSPVLHSFNFGMDLLSKLTIKDISISEKELTEFISSAQELALKLPGTQVVLRCEELLIK